MSRSTKIYQSDRFIPARSGMDFDLCHNMMTDLKLDDSDRDTGIPRHPASYKELLSATFLPSNSLFQPRPLLAIRTSATRTSINVDGLHRFYSPLESLGPQTPSLPSSPAHILDAPDFRDDFYLNIMDWGQNNLLAIGLDQSVYLYESTTENINSIHACMNPRDYVTSVKWSTNMSTKFLLAVGTFLSELQIWDVEAMTQIRSLPSHNARIGSLSWSNILASGSRESIHLSDVRCAQHVVTKLEHRGEVCGLAYSLDGAMLASGSTKNNLCIWDQTMLRSRHPRSVHQHCAPVRALAWSPWGRHILASGGGIQDGTIKLWRATTGILIRSVLTGSQVCALAWSTNTRQLLSAHGYGSDRHEVALWRFKTLDKVHKLTGHKARVLNLAMSPDGSTVVSAGADETLRFWNIFPSRESGSRWNEELVKSYCIR